MTTQKKQGTSKFGWCLGDVEARHEKCITYIGSMRCSCSCHGEGASD